MTPAIVVAAIVASGLGALARHVVAGVVQRHAGGTTRGTAAVNLAGAVLLGLLVGLQGAGQVGPDPVVVLGVGFLGSFTTFSTWMVESVWLAEEPTRWRGAAANIALLLAAGVAGAAAGMAMA